MYQYFNDIAPTCANLIYDYHQHIRVMKFNISIYVQYWHTVEERFASKGFTSRNKVVITDNQVVELYIQIYNEL